MTPPLHLDERPGVSVDNQRVAEEFGIPDGGDIAVGDVRPGEAIEERTAVRIEKRAVGIEGAVLDDQRNLKSGQLAPDLIARPVAQQVQSNRTSIDVLVHQAQGVVVIPQGRGSLIVGVLERGCAGFPVRSGTGSSDSLEVIVKGAFGEISGGDVPGRGQVPGLRVTVALVAGVSAMKMGDNRAPGRCTVWD